MTAAAKKTVSDSASTTALDAQQYLTFLLGGEMYAIGILNIKEIIEYGGLTLVPMMPGFIRGVINLRGSVVPVVDMEVRFGKTASGTTRRSCIVIVEMQSDDGKHDMGVVVDSVSAVLEISGSEIEAAPSFGAKIRTDFIKGMGKVNDKFVIILDADRVLSVDEMSQLSGFSEATGSSG